VTRFLLVADTVHATAAGCDYLADRVDGDDSVIALAVAGAGGDGSARDAADALNVAEIRLPVSVTTERRDGDPGSAVLAAAEKHAVDEIVFVAGSEPFAAFDAALETDLPVVVVPEVE